MSHPRSMLGRLLLLVSLICTSLITPSRPALSQPTAIDRLAADNGDLPTAQLIIKYRSTSAALNAQAAAPATLQRFSDAAAAPLAYVRALTDDTHVLRLPERRPLAEVAAMADRLAALPEIEYAVPDHIVPPARPE